MILHSFNTIDDKNAEAAIGLITEIEAKPIKEALAGFIMGAFAYAALGIGITYFISVLVNINVQVKLIYIIIIAIAIAGSVYTAIRSFERGSRAQELKNEATKVMRSLVDQKNVEVYNYHDTTSFYDSSRNKKYPPLVVTLRECTMVLEKNELNHFNINEEIYGDCEIRKLPHGPILSIRINGVNQSLHDSV